MEHNTKFSILTYCNRRTCDKNLSILICLYFLFISGIASVHIFRFEAKYYLILICLFLVVIKLTTFSRLTVLSIDAMDVSGESQIDVISNVFKQRLHLDGTPIDAEAERHGMEIWLCLSNT